jgi:hypothetical protein
MSFSAFSIPELKSNTKSSSGLCTPFQLMSSMSSQQPTFDQFMISTSKSSSDASDLQSLCSNFHLNVRQSTAIRKQQQMTANPN